MQHTLPLHPRGTSTSAGVDRRTARTTELAQLVGLLSVDDDLLTGSLLAAAVDELAIAAGRDERFGPRTPTVVLLRALSKLAREAPDERSVSARVLLDDHRAAQRGAR